MQPSRLHIWLRAFRLRTLPLAVSSILMGNFLAYHSQQFDLNILILSILTTVFLQILSNLSNDYGDSRHGADSAERTWTQRTVQANLISQASMRNAIFILTALSFVAGIALLWVAFQNHLWWFGVFLTIGILAIVAAITYTSGNKPYGYFGLGDLSVLIFFGLVGVGGSYFLQTKNLDWAVLLPALSCGLFSTAVLNVNNIRDISTDAKAGKRSIPVRLGREKAVWYHWFLLLTGMLTAILFTWQHYQSAWQWLFLFTSPLLIRNGIAVKTQTDSHALDPFLKQMAISTLLFVLLFGIGLRLGSY